MIKYLLKHRFTIGLSVVKQPGSALSKVKAFNDKISRMLGHATANNTTKHSSKSLLLSTMVFEEVAPTRGRT